MLGTELRNSYTHERWYRDCEAEAAAGAGAGAEAEAGAGAAGAEFTEDEEPE